MACINEHSPYLVSREVYDGSAWFSLIEPMWQGVNLSSRFAASRTLKGATRGQVALYTSSVVDAEVFAGGFEQLFFNGSGALAFDALDGLYRVGARHHASVLIEAMLRFPGGQVPRDRFSRRALLDLLPPGGFEALDEDWYTLAENLDHLCNRYVKVHPDEFFSP